MRPSARICGAVSTGQCAISQRCCGMAQTSASVVIQSMRSKRVKIHRPRKASQRFFALRIVVVLEVRHRQLAQVAINRLPKAQPRIVRFRDRAQTSAHPENGEHMVVVAIGRGLQVEQQRRKPQFAQRRRGEQRAFHAMRRTVAQYAARRAARVAVRFFVVSEVVEEALDLVRRIQPAEHSALGGAKRTGGHSAIA